MHAYQFSYKKSTRKKVKSNRPTFIIMASNYVTGNRKVGCIPLVKWNDMPIIDYQLQAIFSAVENPEVVVVCGYDAERLFRRKIQNVRFVENQLYEITNSAEDLRLGLNNISTDNCCVIDGSTIPSADCLTYASSLDNSCVFFHNKEGNDSDIGIHVNDKSFVEDFKYTSTKKLTGISFLNLDTIESYRYIAYKENIKNKFMFEILNQTVQNGLPIRAKLEIENCLKINIKDI